MLSTVSEVTVYTRGARVTRVCKVDRGAKEVRVPRLPVSLDDGSVRVALETKSQARATSVRVALEALARDEALPPADDAEHERAKKDLELARTEVARIEVSIARVASLEVLPRAPTRRGEPPKPIPAEARTALIKLRDGEMDRLTKELAAAKTEREKRERAFAEVHDRFTKASNARNAKEHTLGKTAVISIEGELDGGELSISYLVPGACWAPQYKLTRSTKESTLAIAAVVAQRTGEDWKDATLTLTTADPDRWEELPTLMATRIGRAQPHIPKRGYREPPEGAHALYADYDREFGVPTTSTTEARAAFDIGEALGDEMEELTTSPGDVVSSRSMSTLAGGIQMQGMAPPSQAAAGPMMPEELLLEQLEAAAPMRAKSAGPFGFMARLGGGGPPAPPPPRSAAMPAGRPQRRAEPDVIAEVQASALAFGTLRMAPATDTARGELTAWAFAALEMEGVSLNVEVFASVRAAIDRARIDERRLPPGHVLAEAPDVFDYAYRADVPCTVPSDGAFHVVPLTIVSAKSKMTYVVVPREAPEVFRVLEIESPIDAALLPGPIDCYEERNGAVHFLLTTPMPSTPPRGTLRLGLGVEQAIKVARNARFEEQATGLLGGGLSLHHEIDIEIKNNLAHDVALDVRERIPITRKDDDDVEVTIGKIDPGWEDWDQEDTLKGGHRWRVDVGAQKSRTLAARYTVKIASKHELVGGNRREP